MNKTTEKLRELKNRLDKEADHFDNLINILNSDKSKEKIINDIKRELLLGQLKRNIIVTQEFAKLIAGDVVLDDEGKRILAYAEDVLKEVSKDNKKSHKLY
tara:strand:- start:1622 stop:1924 length:303 start_codon:yes stop_codon:yes gene_type:complete